VTVPALIIQADQIPRPKRDAAWPQIPPVGDDLASAEGAALGVCRDTASRGGSSLGVRARDARSMGRGPVGPLMLGSSRVVGLFSADLAVLKLSREVGK